jgi:hypothetical protein
MSSPRGWVKVCIWMCVFTVCSSDENQRSGKIPVLTDIMKNGMAIAFIFNREWVQGKAPTGLLQINGSCW